MNSITNISKLSWKIWKLVLIMFDPNFFKKPMFHFVLNFLKWYFRVIKELTLAVTASFCSHCSCPSQTHGFEYECGCYLKHAKCNNLTHHPQPTSPWHPCHAPRLSMGPTGFFMRIARSLTSVCLFVCLFGCLFCCLFLAIAFISAKCSSLCASSERISAAHTLSAIEIFIHVCSMLFMSLNCEEKFHWKITPKLHKEHLIGYEKLGGGAGLLEQTIPIKIWNVGFSFRRN